MLLPLASFFSSASSAEASEINALSDYNKELYRLSQAEGDILNKLGIVLDIR